MTNIYVSFLFNYCNKIEKDLLKNYQFLYFEYEFI